MLKFTVQLQIYNEDSSILLTCNHSYVSDVNFMVEIQPADSDRAPEEIMANCSRGYTMNEVQCGTAYTLKAVLMPLNNAIPGSRCVLMASNVTIRYKQGMTLHEHSCIHIA